MGMDLYEMGKMLGFDDIITMIKGDDGSDEFTLILDSPTRHRSFDMKLMDVETAGPIMKIDYLAVVRMPSTEFACICKDLIQFDDTVFISVTKEGVKFSARDDNAHIVKAVKPKDATLIEMKEPFCVSLSLVHLNYFTKANPLSNYVTISLAPEFPAFVEYKIAEMGYLKFY